MVANIKNMIWYEKYRPKTLDEVVLDPKDRQTFDSYISAGEFPHLMFIGPAGTGKTTVAMILLRAVDPTGINTLILNASKDRGIDVVRNKIATFVAVGSAKKYVFLDEFDATTPDFQTALRNLMETYSHKAKFILTGNYPEKIIEPMFSRATPFYFKELPEKEAVKRVMTILESENVTFEPPSVFMLVEEFYPDMRTIINICQKYSITGHFDYDSKSFSKSTFYSQLVEYLKTGSYSMIIKTLKDSENVVNWDDLYSYLFNKAYNLFSENEVPYIHYHIAKTLPKHKQAADPFIIFCGFCLDVMKDAFKKDLGEIK